MRSRGKGKKPLGNEGKTGKGPNVLNGVFTEPEASEEDDDPEPIYLKSRVPKAYAVLKDILAERRGGWIAGFARNFRRNNKPIRWTLNVIVSGVAGAAVALLTGDVIAAIAAATAGIGAPTAVSTAHVRHSRLTVHRREYPDTPEFRDDWAVACYELMLMINGFNLRVKAVARLRRLADEHDDEAKAAAFEETADGMAGLLNEWRGELEEVAEILASYQKEHLESILTDAQTIATIRILDPLKDGLYDWLILDPEIIPPGHEQQLLENDLCEIDTFRDRVDALDPYEKLRREQMTEDEEKP